MSAPFPTPTKTWHDNSYPSISPSRPELSAKGRTVFITGGGTGIGAETLRRFAEAGATRIGILGRREQPLLDTKAAAEREFAGLEIFTASADVTDEKRVEAAFADFAAKYGKINILVSGAAKTGPMEGIGESSLHADQFLSTVDMNIRGALYVSTAFLKHSAPDAVVVDINTSAAHVNFAAKFHCYSVAKLAVFRLWDCIAFAYPKLRIFHLQPGVVDTDMNKEVGGVKAMGFEDHVSLPACFMVWLASPEAEFLKGKFLWSNWDVDELKARAKEIVADRTFNVEMVGWPFGGSDGAGHGSWE